MQPKIHWNMILLMFFVYIIELIVFIKEEFEMIPDQVPGIRYLFVARAVSNHFDVGLRMITVHTATPVVCNEPSGVKEIPPGPKSSRGQKKPCPVCFQIQWFMHLTIISWWVRLGLGLRKSPLTRKSIQIPTLVAQASPDFMTEFQGVYSNICPHFRRRKHSLNVGRRTHFLPKTLIFDIFLR